MIGDTKFLRAFFAVCAEGSFGRAAARLHCTQPAVSYQVRALERDLGALLLERSGRRAVLTPAGRRLLDFCHRYLPELDQVAVEIASGRSTPAEPLRIAAVSGFGRYVLFPALAGLVRDAPESRLDLRFRTAAEVLRQVEGGEVDLGVVYLPKVSNYLAFRPLRQEELVLIAAPALVRGALAGRDLRRLAAYETVPFVTYLEGDYVFGRWFEAHFGAQPARTAGVHHFDELEEVIAMVAAGSGVSIVPLDAARVAITRRQVRAIRPLRGRRCVNQVFAVTRAGGFLRPELERVLAALSQTAPVRLRSTPAPSSGPATTGAARREGGLSPPRHWR